LLSVNSGSVEKSPLSFSQQSIGASFDGANFSYTNPLRSVKHYTAESSKKYNYGVKRQLTRKHFLALTAAMLVLHGHLYAILDDGL
jgi:hypothetical protein